MKIKNLITSAATRKLAVSVALVGTAASVAGLGTFSAFTGSTTASHSVASGTVTPTIGGADTVDNRLTVNASGLAAGDTVQRAVKLSNTGSIGWDSVALTTTALPSSVLDTHATLGLQMVVDKCSVPWTVGGTAPAYTYTCVNADGTAATVTTLIASRQVIGAGMSLGAVASLTPSSSDNLRVTLTLPAAADNSFQGKSSTISYEFKATQRTATAK